MKVGICWKSFQLQPDTKTDPTRNALQHLAERKGWSMDFARQAAADLSARAKDVGLPGDEVMKVLASGQFSDEVRSDIDDALQMGINGVPFFVFDNRYAVSGAQDTSVFIEALTRA